MPGRFHQRVPRRLVAMLVLLAPVFGCATPPGGMRNVSQQTLQARRPHQSLVVGRLTLHDDSGLWKGARFGERGTLIFTEASGTIPDSKDLFHKVDADGYSSLLMEPGEYRIARIEGELSRLFGFQSWTFSVPTPLAFTVRPGVSIYTGSILLEYHIVQSVPRPSIEHQTVATDQFEKDAKASREKHPFLPGEVVDASSASN